MWIHHPKKWIHHPKKLIHQLKNGFITLKSGFITLKSGFITLKVDSSKGGTLEEGPYKDLKGPIRGLAGALIAPKVLIGFSEFSSGFCVDAKVLIGILLELVWLFLGIEWAYKGSNAY